MTIPQKLNCSTYWSHANSWDFEPHLYSPDPSLEDLQTSLARGAVEALNCVGIDGKTALYDAAERLDLPAISILLSYGASIESSGILEDPTLASRLSGYLLLDQDQDLAKTIIRTFVIRGILNPLKQHQRNITALHIAARNGALETVNFILERTPKSQVALNPNVYFTAQTLEDCSVPSEISLLDQIPLDEFSTPAQSYCNTIVRDTKGVLHTLRHTDAKQVHATLAARAQKAPSDNRFTVYMNPGHSFVGLDCSSCANGASYQESFGRYPNLSIEGSGVIVNDSSLGKKYSDENLYLKSTFHISDKQAESIWSKKQSDEIDTKYNPFYDNCVDYVMGFAPILGENHFVDFLPAMQFQVSMEAMKSSEAIQYCVAKYKYGINEDRVVGVISLGTLAASYVAIKTYSKVSGWLFRKNSNADQPPPKTSLTLHLQATGVIQATAVAALRALIPMNEIALSIARLAGFTFTIAVLKNEMQTAKPLNEHKPNSLLNSRVSLAQGIAIRDAIGESLPLGMSALLGKTDPRVVYFSLGSLSIGYSLLGINEIRKFWHDITAPPNIDGLDLS